MGVRSWSSFLLVSLALSPALAAGQAPAPHREVLASVAGTVVRTDTEEKVKKAIVTLMPLSAVLPSGEAVGPAFSVTEGDGRFAFHDLGPGGYLLSAERRGLVTKRRFTQGIPVELRPGQQQSGIVIEMRPAVAITGQVLTEDGEPVERAWVEALRYVYATREKHLMPAGNAMSDDNGEFRIFGLPPGSYYVRATVRELRPSLARTSLSRPETYAPVYYPNARTPDSAIPVQLKQGDETRVSFSLVLVRTFTIKGRLRAFPATSPRGSTAPAPPPGEGGASVMLFSRDSLSPLDARSGVKPDGSFEFSAVPSGNYEVAALETSENQPMTIASVPVAVAEDDVDGVEVSLDQTKVELRGLVRVESGERPDLTQLAVSLLPSDLGRPSEPEMLSGMLGAPATAGLTKDGSFSLTTVTSNNPAHVSLSAAGTGFEDYFIKRVLLGGQDVTESGFGLSGRAAGLLEIVVSTNGGAIEGTVKDGANRPAPGASVVAFPAAVPLGRPDMLQDAVTDQSGHFIMRGVKPGQYKVLALEAADEQPYLDPDFLEQHASEIRTVNVSERGRHRIEVQLISPEEPSL